MITRNLIAAAALAALGTAAMAGPLTRAEVIAERDAYFAQHDSLMAQGESYGTVPVPMAATATPSDTLAAFNGTTIDNDVARGEAYGDVALTEPTAGSADAYNDQSSLFRVNDAYGAQPGMSYQAAPTSGLSRAEVEAELIHARASGEFDARGEVFGDLGNTKFGNLPQHSVAALSAPAEETVVLLVPADGETVMLQPGEAVLLVPDGE